MYVCLSHYLCSRAYTFLCRVLNFQHWGLNKNSQCFFLQMIWHEWCRSGAITTIERKPKHSKTKIVIILVKEEKKRSGINKSLIPFISLKSPNCLFIVLVAYISHGIIGANISTYSRSEHFANKQEHLYVLLLNLIFSQQASESKL